MFSVNFLSNQYVTDEDINNIGYNLSNTVYTSFTNDTVYGVDELNAITGHLMNKGVKRNFKNECSLNLTDGNVHINSGLAFFECGAVMIIDDEGIDVALEESTETQYVYLFFNSTINVGGARCTVEYPSGDFVMLGSVTDGVLKQDRTFAFLNADVKGTNEVVTLILEPIDTKDEKGYRITQYKTDVNITKFNRAFFMTPEDEVRESWSVGYDDACIMGCYDIQNDICLAYTKYTFNTNNRNEADSFVVNSNDYARIEDGKLIVIDFYNDNVSDMGDRHLRIELYGGAAE